MNSDIEQVAADIKQSEFTENLALENVDPDMIASPEDFDDFEDNKDDEDSLMNAPSKQGGRGGKSQRVSRASQIDYRLKYKTELCKQWEMTKACKFGTECAFAHGHDELRKKVGMPSKYRTIKCKSFHNNGYCVYGSRCQFQHDPRMEKANPTKQELTKKKPDSPTGNSSSSSSFSFRNLKNLKIMSLFTSTYMTSSRKTRSGSKDGGNAKDKEKEKEKKEKDKSKKLSEKESKRLAVFENIAAADE